MATNDMLQYLEPAASGGTATASNRRQVETFLVRNVNGSGVTVTINAGDWVAFDMGRAGSDKALYVIPSPAAAGAGTIVGVADETVSIPEPPLPAGTVVEKTIRVVISGYVASANVATGVGAGVSLMASATAGRAAQATVDATGGATEPAPAVCGMCLTLAAGNVAEVMVVKRF